MDNTEQKLDEVVRKDPRYAPEAYVFLLAALESTMQEIGERRHVTGQELSHGIRRFALREYGLMARNVLESWGLKATDDFGNLVYNLIEVKVLSKTETDRIEDFHDVFAFDQAFSRNYQFGSEEPQREAGKAVP